MHTYMRYKYIYIVICRTVLKRDWVRTKCAINTRKEASTGRNCSTKRSRKKFRLIKFKFIYRRVCMGRQVSLGQLRTGIQRVSETVKIPFVSRKTLLINYTRISAEAVLARNYRDQILFFIRRSAHLDLTTTRRDALP